MWLYPRDAAQRMMIRSGALRRESGSRKSLVAAKKSGKSYHESFDWP
ncbi:hypothetical protein RISK_004258 [Rhodopirellula islandica]|uniref:Uncharacterized protein n=1 Tax=Rhodopirellula islandica TaxID=595434 RepID=A0A0J1BBD9_RHOIS|nr:hypothetical protein RISK_004258 [Rhodopirellula islandica]